MLVTRCDRCGKDIPKDEKVFGLGTFDKTTASYYHWDNQILRADLCFNCHDKVQKLLNTYKIGVVPTDED